MSDSNSTGLPAVSQTAVRVDRVDIRYRVYEEQFHSARNLVSAGFRSRRATEVRAVNDVTFDVKVGEAVGIIGSNGSGKSTLLRAIAGLQSLANGSIQVRGEAHLLGVGAALKPTLSGYRNVMLGGLAMGLPRDEIEGAMASVVEFSGLAEAMGRPMNTYSSGMRARLAFSIATLRVPDILLIDEALAVGDKDFRERSLQRIRDIREQTGTVVMVTHNLSEIRDTCSRAIWLDGGSVVTTGPPAEVIERYEQH